VVSTERCHVFALLGSGETSPTMVGLHKELVARLEIGGRSGAGSAALVKPRAMLLETPYRFQENAADISTRAQAYFARSVGLGVDVVAGLHLEGSTEDGLAAEATESDELADVAAVRSADWVFSGPGSPTYALKHWRNHPIGRALRDRLASGPGVTILASAAAATAGVVALPVYEIYKVGETPHWLEGLDVMRELDLQVAVIPHFDNAEGGTHDTRYCYLGERRLRLLERELPKGAAVYGIDEHTAAVFDLVAATVHVHGRGGVTIRRGEEITVLPAGSELRLADLQALVRGDASAPAVTRSDQTSADAGSASPTTDRAARPLTLMEITKACERRFDEGLRARDAGAMVAAILELESAIREWAADTEEDEGTAQAAEVMRTLIVRLGEVATDGLRDPAHVLAPVVEPLLKLRDSLRREKEYRYADAIRDALVSGGLELHDLPDETRWSVASG